jgi:hypothetical protein
MNEINPTGDYEHRDDVGVLEERFADEAAHSPNALRIGARRALALGAIVGVAFIAGVPQKVVSVFNNANQASYNAAAGNTIPSTSNPAALQAEAQHMIDKNHLSQIGAEHHRP